MLISKINIILILTPGSYAVIYDYRHSRKSPLPDFMVDKFRETFHLQQVTKRRNGIKVMELLGRVQRLERGSWDRVDAVEDKGTLER